MGTYTKRETETSKEENLVVREFENFIEIYEELRRLRQLA